MSDMYLHHFQHGDIDEVRKQGDYAFVTLKSHEGALRVVNNPPPTICGAEVKILTPRSLFNDSLKRIRTLEDIWRFFLAAKGAAFKFQ